MKATLKFKERLVINSLLPQQANFVTLLIIGDIKAKVGITTADQAAIDLKVLDNGNMQWDPEKDVGTVLTFSKAEVEVIRKELVSLNTADKLTADHVDTYKMFVNDEEQTNALKD